MVELEIVLLLAVEKTRRSVKLASRNLKKETNEMTGCKTTEGQQKLLLPRGAAFTLLLHSEADIIQREEDSQQKSRPELTAT